MVDLFNYNEYILENITKQTNKTNNDTKPNFICLDCNVDDSDLIESDGYVICKLCGSVVGTRISELAEWNNYTDSSGAQSNNSRCGIYKSTDINPFIGELISYIPKGTNNKCYIDGKVVVYDVSKIHVKNNFNHLQKSFSNVENLLDNITSDKYSKRIVSTAKILWSEIMLSKKITRAGVRKGLIACCLYYSCIHYNCSRSPIEICKNFNMEDTKQFNKGDKEFKETFENSVEWSHLITKTSSSYDYFSRFCSDLEMNHLINEGQSFKLAKECREIYDKIKEKLVGLFPKSAACGIIFWCMKNNKMHITKTSLSSTLGICSPSLSKCCNIVIKELGPFNV